MRTAAILPVKSFGSAKQRLGELIEQDARSALMRAMLADVLDALARVPELEQVLVVTANPLAGELEGDPRIHVLHDDREAGQSAAALIGIAHARDAGFDRALLVPGDAPLLDPAELSALLARPEPLVIVPDRHGTGTNGLLLAPVDAFEPSLRAGQPRPPRGGRAGHGPAVGGRPPALAGPGRGHARGPGGHHGPARRRARDPGGAAAPVAAGVSVTATALEGVPEVRAGRRPGRRCWPPRPEFAAGDILVVAHKVVSKAEGRVRDLAAVEPGERARDLAAEHGKDPRLVQVVLDESAEVLRAHHGVLICLTHHGFVCANAGVDRSNAPGDDQVVLLPADPDASARALRAALPGRPAVVVTDSFGRAWRVGQTDVAIGAAGIAAAGRLARPPRRPRPGDGGHRDRRGRRRGRRRRPGPRPRTAARPPCWCAAWSGS